MNNSFNGIKIKQRKDKRWYASWQVNNKRTYIYGKTKEDVYNQLKEIFKKELNSKHKKITFFEYWQIWYNKYKKPFIKENSLKNYRSVFNNQIKKSLKDKELEKYTALDINIFLNKLENNRMKEYTCQYVKQCFKQAFKDKQIKFDISEELIKYNHKRKEGNVLTQEQRQKLLENYSKIENGDIFLFYLFTGCRPSEALTIKPTDFDLKHEVLHITGTKTEGSDRYIPIFTPIIKIYNERKNNKPYIYNLSYESLKTLNDKMKKICNFNFVTKDLRTTFGTMCAENNIPEYMIAKWMGHTTTQTTRKYYIKVLSEYEKQQVKIIDNTFDSTFNHKKIDN